MVEGLDRKTRVGWDGGYESGFQPSRVGGRRTQGCALGWYESRRWR